jgi:hypothetical protein
MMRAAASTSVTSKFIGVCAKHSTACQGRTCARHLGVCTSMPAQQLYIPQCMVGFVVLLLLQWLTIGHHVQPYTLGRIQASAAQSDSKGSKATACKPNRLLCSNQGSQRRPLVQLYMSQMKVPLF